MNRGASRAKRYAVGSPLERGVRRRSALPKRSRTHAHGAAQPCGLNTLSLDGGFLLSFAAGRTGLATSSPPQFGQMFFSFCVAQLSQNVHSNEQILASFDSGGRSTSQHSHDGRSCSTFDSFLCLERASPETRRLRFSRSAVTREISRGQRLGLRAA